MNAAAEIRRERKNAWWANWLIATNLRILELELFWKIIRGGEGRTLRLPFSIREEHKDPCKLIHDSFRVGREDVLMMAVSLEAFSNYALMIKWLFKEHLDPRVLDQLRMLLTKYHSEIGERVEYRTKYAKTFKNSEEDGNPILLPVYGGVLSVVENVQERTGRIIRHIDETRSAVSQATTPFQLDSGFSI